MKLVTINQSSNEDAIIMMEEIIEQIKSGDITSIALAWVNKDGSISGDVSSGNNSILLWSAMIHAERSFYDNVVLDD